MPSLDRFVRLVRYLRPYRVRLIAAFVCSGLVAAFSGAYAWLVRPVLDEIFINKDETLLLALPLALFAVSVLKSAFNYGQNYLMNYVGNQVIADIRQELFGKLIRLPVKYHDANTSGRLVSRVVNDVTFDGERRGRCAERYFPAGSHVSRHDGRDLLPKLETRRSLGHCDPPGSGDHGAGWASACAPWLPAGRNAWVIWPPLCRKPCPGYAW
jgi:hypothetical protein